MTQRHNDAAEFTTAASRRHAATRDRNRHREQTYGPTFDAMSRREIDDWLRSLGPAGVGAAELGLRLGYTRGIVRLFALRELERCGGDTAAPRLIGSDFSF